MKINSLLFAAVAASATLLALPAFAQAPQNYGTVLKRGTTVNEAQRQQYEAPGVTDELSSDTKQSATGGPSGGVARGGAAGGN